MMTTINQVIDWWGNYLYSTFVKCINSNIYTLNYIDVNYTSISSYCYITWCINQFVDSSKYRRDSKASDVTVKLPWSQKTMNPMVFIVH